MLHRTIRTYVISSAHCAVTAAVIIASLSCSNDGNTATNTNVDVESHAVVQPFGPEEYCQQDVLPTPNVLPTSTPDPDIEPTPVSTAPPAISSEDFPEEWIAKMGEIETWVQGYYETDRDAIGDVERIFIDDSAWEMWERDKARDSATRDESTSDLWQQIYRTLTLLSPNGNLTSSIADYRANNIIGRYDRNDRKIFMKVADSDFGVLKEATYAHEYAHHIQNELYNFNAAIECFSGDSDAINAFAALIEGDAFTTQIAYIEDEANIDRYQDALEKRLAEQNDEVVEIPPIQRYIEAQSLFTYIDGWDFVYSIAEDLVECDHCQTERQRIYEAFRNPPTTTEQVLEISKYFRKERRTKLNLNENLMGDEWRARYASTFGNMNWIALLLVLTGEYSELEGPGLPRHELHLKGWMGDYRILLEDDNRRAIYITASRWENDRYINRLIEAFDDRAGLTLIQDSMPAASLQLEGYYVWQGDTGSIALGYTAKQYAEHPANMYLAIGPDTETVNEAVVAAHKNLVVR